MFPPKQLRERIGMADSNANSGEGPSVTSLSLLARARDKDQAAWRRLVSVYYPVVYGWCRQARLQQADAADVTQNVFESVYRSITSFRHRRPTDSFRAWLRTITKNKIKDWARKPPEVTGVAELEEHAARPHGHELSDSDEASDMKESRMIVLRALELLRRDFQERTWQAFMRVTMEGARPKDVAKELGMSVKAVYMARWRVLVRLREEFAGLIEGEPL
jgi:RNA polymerase sigma-70 factor (ECF subfamily)